MKSQHKIICLEGIDDYSYCPAKTLNRVTEVSRGSVLLWVTVQVSISVIIYPIISCTYAFFPLAL